MNIDFSQIKIPYLQKQQIWDQADFIRLKHWGDKIPVNVDIIAERGFDIQLIPINGLKHCANTEAFLLSTLDEIVFDINSPDVRLRFSIAHELGHRVLHPNLINALRTNSYEEWKEMINNIPPHIWGSAEFQAREFAGRLLVPRTHLINIIKDNKPMIDKAKNAAPDLEVSALNEYLSRHLSSPFNVSADVINARLLSEEINSFKVVA